MRSKSVPNVMITIYSALFTILVVGIEVFKRIDSATYRLNPSIISEVILAAVVLFNLIVIPRVLFLPFQIIFGIASVWAVVKRSHLYILLILLLLSVAVLIFFPWKDRKKARWRVFAYIILLAVCINAFALLSFALGNRLFLDNDYHIEYGPGKYGLLIIDQYGDGKWDQSDVNFIKGKVQHLIFYDRYEEYGPWIIRTNKVKCDDFSIEWLDESRVVINGWTIDYDEVVSLPGWHVISDTN